jgi:hypothetical protein
MPERHALRIRFSIAYPRAPRPTIAARGINLGTLSFAAAPVLALPPQHRPVLYTLVILHLLSLANSMRVLFAISILAFAALLWASIAIVRHVRRARRQRVELLRSTSSNSSTTSPNRSHF